MTGKLKPNLCCHLLLPKNKSCVTQLLWRPRPGHWCSQGRNIWAVAEACGHYPRRMLLGVANQLTQAIDHQAQRWMENWHCTTSKPCLHSNLQTLRSVGTSAVAACCVSIAAHKRRPRNRPCPIGLCWSAVVKNSAKVRLPKKLSLLVEGSVWVESCECPNTNQLRSKLLQSKKLWWDWNRKENCDEQNTERLAKGFCEITSEREFAFKWGWKFMRDILKSHDLTTIAINPELKSVGLTDTWESTQIHSIYD